MEKSVCFLLGKLLFKLSNSLISVIQTLLRWKQRLRGGMLTLNDAERSYRINSAVVPENTNKHHKLLLTILKLKVHEIVEDLKISEGSLFTILHEHLFAHRRFKKNNTSKIQSVVCYSFNATKRIFCVYMWQWMNHGSSTSLWIQIGYLLSGLQQVKPFKATKDANITNKVLVTLFWDAQGILFLDYLEKRRIINREFYIALFVRLEEEITKKQEQMKKIVPFLQHNPPCHKSIARMAKLHELHFKLFHNHPFSRFAPTPQRRLAVCRSQ